MPFNIINEQRNTFNKLETFVQDFSLLLEAILVFSCFFFSICLKVKLMVDFSFKLLSNPLS